MFKIILYDCLLCCSKHQIHLLLFRIMVMVEPIQLSMFNILIKHLKEQLNLEPHETNEKHSTLNIDTHTWNGEKKYNVMIFAQILDVLFYGMICFAET